MPRHARAIDKNVASWPKPIPVKNWMQQPVVTIPADTTCREAIESMRAHRIRHLPVVEQDRLLGIVTDRDLRQVLFDPALSDRVTEAADILEHRTVRDVMTWAVVTVAPHTNIRQAARLMHEQRIGALPVVDGRRLVGMLTEHDILRAFAAQTPEGVTRVSALEVSVPVEEPYEYGFARPGNAADQRA
jgi:acetoin utilization protein AcuB